MATLGEILEESLKETPFSLKHVRTILIELKIFTEAEVGPFLATPDRFSCVHEINTRRSAFPVSENVSARYGVTTAWGSFVTEKYLKALASEYALQCLAKGDTASATSSVALLVQEDNLFPAFGDVALSCLRERHDGGVHQANASEVRVLFRNVLFLLLLYGTSKHAAQLALPAFKVVAESQQSYAADLPQLLSYLLPGRSFQHTTRYDRLAMVFDQMHERGYRFHIFVEARELSAEAVKDLWEAVRQHSSPANAVDVPDGEKAKTVRDKKRFIPISYRSVMRLEKSLTCLRALLTRPDDDEDDTTALGFVAGELAANVDDMAVARLPLVTPRQLYARVITEGSMYRTRRRAETKRRSAAKASKVNELTSQDVAMVMRVVHRLLRMQSPYADKLDKEGLLDDMTRSAGWLPLSHVQRFVNAEVSRLNKVIPEDRDDIVEELLQSHDCALRFEVGTCRDKASPFFNQRCSRSLYGHDSMKRKIFKQTISRGPPLTDLEAVPKYGWIMIDKRLMSNKDSARLTLPVYENIPFIVVFPAEAIAFFRHYRQITLPERQYDEKLKGGKPLFFLEVCLHALLKDKGNIRVYPNKHARTIATDELANPEEPSAGRDDCHNHDDGDDDDQDSQIIRSRWYVFPNYLENEEMRRVYTPGDGRHGRFGLPKIFLTGRCACLGAMKADSPHAEAQGEAAPTGLTRCVVRCSAKPVSSTRIVDSRDARRMTRREFALPTSFLGLGEGSDGGPADREAGSESGAEEDWDAESNSEDDEGGGGVGGGGSGGGNDTDAQQYAASCSDSAATSLRTYDASRELHLLGARWQTAVRLDSAGVRASEASERFSFPTFIPSARQLFSEYLADASAWSARVAALSPAGADDEASDGEALDGESSPKDRFVSLWQLFPRMTINLDAFRQSFDAFLLEDNRYMLLWRVPKGLRVAGEITGFPGRTDLIREMKAYVLGRGLRISLFRAETEMVTKEDEFAFVAGEYAPRGETGAVTGGGHTVMAVDAQGGHVSRALAVDNAASPDRAGAASEPFPTDVPPPPTAAAPPPLTGELTSEVFEIAKPFLWTREEIVAAARELDLDRELQGQLALLRTAFTRECENSTDNYEMLEFIGDAVMDFIVSLDGFLSVRLFCNRNREGEGLKDTRGSVLTLEQAVALSCREIERLQDPTDSIKSNTTAATDEDDAQTSRCASLAALAGFCGLKEADPGSLWRRMSTSAVFPVVFGPTTQITTALCRNAVLTQLLPQTVNRHFDRLYGGTMHAKVRADVFEAILGVVYRSDLGLDRFRRVLRHLYRQLPLRLCAALLSSAGSNASDGASDDSSEILSLALASCPYVFDTAHELESAYSFRTVHLIDAPLVEQFMPEDAEARDAAALASIGLRLPNATATEKNSHTASTLFPRIQEKSYASHFTTGLGVYSYRRIFSNDSARLFSRILHIFQIGGFAFTNEIVTETTHLVFDFDGANVDAFNVAGLFWRWYMSRLGFPSAAAAPAMVVLDCTGFSVVTKKTKESCHIHFPQVVVRVSHIAVIRDDFLHYLFSALDEYRGRLRDSNAGEQPTPRAWRQVLMTSTFIHSALASEKREPHRHVLLGHSSFHDLLALSHVSRVWRYLVFEHVASILERGDLGELAALFGVTEPGRIIQGHSRGAVAVVEDQERELWLLPEEWLAGAQKGGSAVTVTPQWRDREEWDSIVDGGMPLSKKLRMYLCDKCDTVYGFEHRPLLLDQLLLPRGALRVERPDKQLAAQGGLRLTRDCQKALLSIRNAAAARASQAPPQQQTTTNDHSGEVARWQERAALSGATEANSLPSSSGRRLFRSAQAAHAKDGDAAPFTVCVAHASTLRLTSLRCPQYRDTHGLLYDAWEPGYVAADGVGGSGAMVVAREVGVPNAGEGVFDQLPSYDSVMLAPAGAPLAEVDRRDGTTHRVRSPALLQTPQCVSWDAFENSCALQPKGQRSGDKSFATAASWWAYSLEQRTATFYIAAEPVYRVQNCDSLAHALSSASRPDAMEAVAHLLMPHINYTAAKLAAEYTTSYAPDVMPLFSELVKRVPKPVAADGVDTDIEALLRNLMPGYGKKEQAPQHDAGLPSHPHPAEPPQQQPTQQGQRTQQQQPPQQPSKKKKKKKSGESAAAERACIEETPYSAVERKHLGVRRVTASLPCGVVHPTTKLPRMKTVTFQQLGWGATANNLDGGYAPHRYAEWWSLVATVVQSHAVPTTPLVLFESDDVLWRARQACPPHARHLASKVWSAQGLAAFTASPPLLLADLPLHEQFSLAFLFIEDDNGETGHSPCDGGATSSGPLSREALNALLQSLVGSNNATVFTNSGTFIDHIIEDST